MKIPRAFTLIETLIAVTILTFALAGPFASANRALVASYIARDQLTASYLAQEGIEYVRLMRDNEYLAFVQSGSATPSSSSWTDFISGSSAASITGCRATTCTLDPVLRSMGTGSGFSLQPCSGASCTPLYLAAGLYTQRSDLGGTQTVYTRTIQAVDIPSFPNDERIVSKVTWTTRGQTYSITVTDHLTPWQ